MTKYITFLFILCFVASCAPAEEGVIPTDLKAKKELIKTKKAELKELQAKIDEIQAAIDEQDPKEEKRSLVKIAAIEKTNFNHYVDIQGSVMSDDIAMASSETGGRVIKLNTDEGKAVRRGQLIASIDMDGLKKQKAELETRMQLAKEVYERQKRLWDQNIGSEIQFLQAKNNKEALEKSLETIDFNLTKSSVYAPISGVVERVFVKTGEMAGPGAPIVQILNTRNVKVVANVPETYLQAVKRGATVTVTFPALGREQKAKISEISRVINPANRTFSVEVNLSNKDGLLKPNLLANMLINDYTLDNVIVVPLELVQQDVSGKSFVYVTEKGTNGLVAKKVLVTTGKEYEGQIVIDSGLTGAETLITSGARALVEGEMITTK